MGKTAQITVDDIRGIYVNFPTAVRRDIVLDRNAKNVVDLDEAARAADAYVRDGVAGFILNGTFGEYGALTFEEWRDFTRAVVEAVKDRAQVYAGITTLNTRDTMERCRVAREIGAHGFNVGRPMQSPLNPENIVQWHRDIADECPDMAMLLYDDPAAFKGPMVDAVYAELAKIPQIVAGKFRGNLDIGTQFPNTYASAMKVIKGNIKLLPIEINWATNYAYNGTDACWSSTFGMVPGAVKRLQDAIFAGDPATIKQIEEDINTANAGLMVREGLHEIFHINKVFTLKMRTDTAGYYRCGPSLPPYTHAPQERRDTAIACGMRDRELQKKYPHSTASKTTAFAAE